MPMPAKGPHLALRRRKGRPDTWVIRDTGRVELSTGTGERREAERQLARYLADKLAPPRAAAAGPLPPDAMTGGDVLDLYVTEHVPTVADPKRLLCAARPLIEFWGETPIAGVTRETCARYGRWRERADGTVRRELNVLQAAINHAVREGRLTSGRQVVMPPEPETRQRALTRDEAARLLRAARRLGHTHVARFILVALYTGSRRSAILGFRLDGPSTTSGYFDLERGVLYRRGAEERRTNKRRPPARLPRQLLAHARRWRAAGARWAVEWRGQRVHKLRHSWGAVVAEAGLDWTPSQHTLKHTAITWAVAAGASIEDISGYFGTSPKTILRVYWDRSAKWQAAAVEAVERMGRRK